MKKLKAKLHLITKSTNCSRLLFRLFVTIIIVFEKFTILYCIGAVVFLFFHININDTILHLKAQVISDTDQTI